MLDWGQPDQWAGYTYGVVLTGMRPLSRVAGCVPAALDLFALPPQVPQERADGALS